MIISCGTTRIVVLVGNSAIKIARFRPLRLVFRMILFPFQSEKKRQIFYSRYGTMPYGMWRYVFAGLWANRNECCYWKQFRDARVMPSKRLLGYLIIIQPKGVPLSDEEFESKNPFRNLTEFIQYRAGYSSLSQSMQFAKTFDGRVLLVDYGEAATCKILQTTQTL